MTHTDKVTKSTEVVRQLFKTPLAEDADPSTEAVRQLSDNQPPMTPEAAATLSNQSVDRVLASAGKSLAFQLAVDSDDPQKFVSALNAARTSHGENFYSYVLPHALYHLTYTILEPYLAALGPGALRMQHLEASTQLLSDTVEAGRIAQMVREAADMWTHEQ